MSIVDNDFICESEVFNGPKCKVQCKSCAPKHTDTCPHCHSDLDGGPIPENIRQHYSPPYRWSRKVLVKCGRAIAPGHDYYQCPDCKGTWPA